MGTQDRGKIVTQGFIAEYAITLNPDINEHLLGKHDQSTHGRSNGGKGETPKSAKKGHIKAEPKPKVEKPEKVPAPKKVAAPKAKKATTKAEPVTKPQDKTIVDPLKRPFAGDALAGKTVSEKEKLLAEQGNAEWLKSLPDAQKNAIAIYTGGSYRQINTALRTGKSLPQYQPFVNDINAALLQSHAPADMVVTRGVSSGRFQNILDHVGGTFVDKGFSSTTINSSADYKYEAQVSIHVFKGAPGGYVAPISAFSPEAEWIPPSGSHFTVTQAYTSNGVNHVVMEYRGQPHLTASQLTAYESTRSDQSQSSSSSKFVWQDGDIEWLDEKGEEDDE